MVPWEGTRRNGLCFERLSTPATLETSSKLTGKLLTFVIWNYFSAVSFTSTLEKEMRPSSGATVTSGRTPTPLRFTDTIVESE